ncbi:aminotransferase class I/II-fold pyridoxal phosphate-dependent enzyme [Lacrimispora sp. NSJ-141]|uniref:Aminotransferase n=1 Tax=Lientehia hominis TaxID=2897778 RepID=A0AAP2RIP7_9FIRM|nr:aminotransferase class I/II-fold pyridoxal phosphate-dependent enzyme [Lientehia hominis]MCD2492154.1 aminotransferase class I/II-fold pyridoxal phosphate-dependent enzyme [Lientehia hominis]
MQAIILAAGMGKRLKELTKDATKCMVKVDGVTLIERALTQLDGLGLSRIVIVVGYEGQKLMDYIRTLSIETPIIYVDNQIYYKTNNIYSLYMAKDYLTEEDTLLLESDLIFEKAVLEKLVYDPYPSLALVAKYESWMDGTVVTLDEEDNILDFIGKKSFRFSDVDKYYKTVNIYKFGKEFSNSHYVPFLEAYCKALGNNEYYEQVLKVITLLDTPVIKGLRLNGELWYEIDDEQDLDIAESLFAGGEEKLKKISGRYGGYWRYPHLKDFCYLVNPFYPGEKLVDELKASFTELLTNYPSGMEVNSLVAAKYFGLKKEQVCVGNGAAELIKLMMEMVPGKLGTVYPTFEEYPNRKKEELEVFTPGNRDFTYTADELMEYFGEKDIAILVLINPDNPSGSYIPGKDVLRMAEWAERKNIRFVLDESFVDFADGDMEENSLLHQDVLIRYPALFVVKSISKSYGVPGLRLGVIAGSDTKFIGRMKKQAAIWNINSFGEYYMQIAEKYKGDYSRAMELFKEVRSEYIASLNTVPHLRPIPSQANYLMCELMDGFNSSELAASLLEKYDLLIKDLSAKRGFGNGQYIRLAVKRPEENELLLKALKTELSGPAR